ncbi:unnamed protein product [Rotaria sordida]|uniref:AB hydrolase-1 domain-containing protein n=1 Tax=Rotaria sordida TaxID=392033 RepID=A0A815MAG1_9BILA|nr:unnamed protein product [Rotaria sordida]CAF4114643.1 unnamed protein product [Rotaria sordida]
MEKPIQFHEITSEILSDLSQNFHTLASEDKTITTIILSEYENKMNNVSDIKKTMTTTTNDFLLTNGNDSASNAIDQMISLSVLNHDNTTNQNSNILILNQTSITKKISSPSRFRTIENLKRFTWKSTGPEKLLRAEMRIFETVKSQFQGRYINVLNDTQKIWTVCSNLTSKNIPVVLIHGFGGGIGLWSLNLDQLCIDRPVYALDLPGFAHSTRPIFSLDPDEAEQQFVNMLEEWRIGIGLNERFILLGHSFGGFLSASYTIRYPKYVEQLVLVDAWGFERKPDNWQESPMQRIPP